MRMAMRWMLVLALLAGAAAAQDDEDVGARFMEQERDAFALFEQKQWTQAITAFEQQIAIYGDNPRPYYNIACAYALQGNANRAAIWLALAMDHGWRDVRHLDGDGDWDRVRDSGAYKSARERLVRAAKQDPPPMPRSLPLDSVRSANSVVAIQTAAILGEQQLELDTRLLEEREIRRRLFILYDHVMARLARYIAENGDAYDADRAGRERVRIASLYAMRARDGDPADDELRRVGASYVRLSAEEFVERWPGSPELARVLLWRAAVEPDDTAAEQFDRIRRDFPGTVVAMRASAEWCVRQERKVVPELMAAAYQRFVEDYGKTPLGQELLATRLWRIRLRVEGLPDLARADIRPALEQPNSGPLLIAVVIAGDEESARMLAGMRKRAGRSAYKIVVACLPEQRSPEQQAWLDQHAQGISVAHDAGALVRMLRIPDAPLLLEFRDGRLKR